MIWDEFLRHFRFCDEEDSGLSDENRLNLIEYKEKESFLDYMDGERIRVSLKNYLMQYDSIDDIIKAI